MIAQRYPLFVIQAMIIFMSVAVKLFGIKRTVNLFIKKSAPASEFSEHKLDIAESYLKRFRRARKKAIFKGNCLSQSLALHWLIRKNHINSTIHIGVQIQPKFKAHAWVEYAGHSLNAHPDVRKRYKTVDEFNNLKLNGFS